MVVRQPLPRPGREAPALLVMEAGGDLAGGAGTRDRSLQMFPKTPPWPRTGGRPKHQCTGPAEEFGDPPPTLAPTRVQGRRGWGLPPVSAFRVGIGAGGGRGSASSWLLGRSFCPQGRLPPVALERPWGWGGGATTETPGSVRTGEAGSALDQEMSGRDCP